MRYFSAVEDVFQRRSYMKSISNVSLLVPVLALACMIVPSAKADLTGTLPIAPTSTVFPGLVPPGTNPGTLLAAESEPFSFTTTGGTTSGFLDSAVYNDGGTLDFYYQVFNNASSATSLARMTATSFVGFTSGTAVGFRVDGGSLGTPVFVDGTVAPVTADMNSTGSVIGFSFSPPDSAKIAPGSDSTVLVISTDATRFTNGNASVIDGGTQTVASFQPTTVPEPRFYSLLLFAGIVAGAVYYRKGFRAA
jgi:hypothetical protein